jgi:hypothetical protein
VQSQSLGSVEFGQIFAFPVSDRLTTGAAAAWDPAFFDVFDCQDGSRIIANQALTRETDRDLWFGTIDTSQGVTETGEVWRVSTYAVIVKPDATENPSNFSCYSFTVTASHSARLKRLLGLLGENLVLDAFSYDSAGNCTSYRIRLFETRSGAESASAGITDVPEPGEIATYVVNQEYAGGRRLRVSHVSLIDEDREEA